MIPLKLDVVADALGGVCRSDDDPQTITIHRVAIDSRDAQTGDLYVAIRGERFDGHRFMAEAVSRGAVACVAQRDHPLASELSAPVSLVDDTVKAMGRLASYYRREVLPASATVIAITGSKGKTTTKRMIDHVLCRSLTGVAAPKNFNNDIGVPLTLLSAPANARYVVVEIGSNAKGEVAALAEMTAPDAAVITSIGEAHMEGLGDLEAIAAEKGSILDHVRPGGLAVVNIDQPEIMPFVRRFTRGRCGAARFGSKGGSTFICPCPALTTPRTRLRRSPWLGGLVLRATRSSPRWATSRRRRGERGVLRRPG